MNQDAMNPGINKRVCLVFPRIVSGWQAHPRMAIPMNLLCMATQVDRVGYQVQFIDQRTERVIEQIINIL